MSLSKQYAKLFDAEKASSPEGLIMKSHFLSGLFQHSLILDPVLQRQESGLKECCYKITQDSCNISHLEHQIIKCLQLGTAQTSGGTPGNHIDWSLQSQLWTKKKKDTKWVNRHTRRATALWINPITCPFLHLVRDKIDIQELQNGVMPFGKLRDDKMD